MDTSNILEENQDAKKLLDKYELKDVRKFWGFGVRYDWIDENGKNLSDIFEE